MSVNRTNGHLFALYYPVADVLPSAPLRITDADLIHRIERVLRLAVGDTCILFNKTHWMKVTISSLSRSLIVCTILEQQQIERWQPKITFFLPILKRDALAAAIYNLVEAGVTEIQLINTEKIHRDFGGAKELERLERVAIAAAEQSKNFALPIIQLPIAWQESLARLQQHTSYVGDPQGIPSALFFKEKQHRVDVYNLIIGPEGDFTPDEYKQLKDGGVIALQLTPTILRAEMAAFYIAALVRSFFMR